MRRAAEFSGGWAGRDQPRQIEGQIIGCVRWRMRAQKGLGEIEEHVGQGCAGIDQTQGTKPAFQTDEAHDHGKQDRCLKEPVEKASRDQARGWVEMGGLFGDGPIMQCAKRRPGTIRRNGNTEPFRKAEQESVGYRDAEEGNQKQIERATSYRHHCVTPSLCRVRETPTTTEWKP